MHTIDVADPQPSSVLVLDGAPQGPGTVRVLVRLQDGRSFSLNLLTLEGVRERLDKALAFAAPSLLLVRDASDQAISEAVRAALAQGIERFGVLDAPLRE